MNGTCIIFCALDNCREKPPVKEGDFVIAADGGYKTTRRFNIKPDLILGDFDSLGYIPDAEAEVFPTVKDYTDSYIAVTEGLKRGFDKFVLYGAVGGRSDHTFANIQLLALLSGLGKQAFAVGNGEVVFVLTSKDRSYAEDVPATEKIQVKRDVPLNAVTMKTDKKTTFSVFSLSDVSHGVTETGTEYLLDNYTLTNLFPLGISNTFSNECRISVQSGILCVTAEKEDFNPNDFVPERI